MRKNRRSHIASERHIQQSCLDFVYDNLKISLAVGFLPATLAAAALWNSVSHEYIFLWLGYFTLISAMRFMQWQRYWRTRNTERDLQQWQHYYVLGCILGGSAWGMGGAMLMPAHDMSQQVLLVYCLGGVVFWAARSMTPFNLAFLGFTASALLPVALWMLYQRDLPHVIMAMMLLVFIVALAFLANNFSREFRETFILRFENTELVKELKYEIQQRKQTENIALLESRILAMILHNDPLQRILHELNHGIESIFPNTMSSILFLDDNGECLHLGSAPSLPAAYSAAIEGARIGPAEGSCGTAAYHNRQVIVSDIANSPLWKAYRELALSHKLRACWSVPIRGEKNMYWEPLHYITSIHMNRNHVKSIRWKHSATWPA